MSWREALGVARAEPIAGGDINDAFRATLRDGRTVFVKTNARAPAGMFAAEAAGLDWLRGGALVVPRALAAGADWLALEWLDLDDAPDPAAFGRGLAELHARGAPRFGHAGASFIATLPQDNAATDAWPAFYVERRLRPMIERGIARGAIDPAVRAALDRIPAEAFGPPEPPARLHGDLWWGNVRGTRGGVAIFDPAVYGGHREVDLAMLALFGGVPAAAIERCLRAYEERAPLAPGWRDRVALYQTYPVAVHAVLFGGGYGATLARTLARY